MRVLLLTLLSLLLVVVGCDTTAPGDSVANDNEPAGNDPGNNGGNDPGNNNDPGGDPGNTAPTAPTQLFVHSTNAQNGSAGSVGSPAPNIDTTPVFSAVYADPDAGDTADAYRIQVHDQVDFNGPSLWLSDAAGTPMPAVVEGNRCANIAYAGAPLETDRTYYWRIIFRDVAGAWSAISTTGAFTVPYEVPAPKPINIPYTLGCIYMPKPHMPSHQWTNVKLHNSANEIKLAQGTRHPLLGYYEGDSPVMMDWQIKWAVDRGITFFVFDDYWTESSDAPLYDQPVRALFGAKYGSQMQFAIELTVNDTISQSRESKRAALLQRIIPWYIEHYFGRDNYLLVEGRPMIHLLNYFTAFGTNDAAWVRSTIDACNQLIADNTPYAGAYWVTNDIGSQRMNFDRVKSSRIDAVMPYYGLPWLFPFVDENTWPVDAGAQDPNQQWPPGVPYSTARDEAIRIHNEAFAEARRSGVKFITGISPDFDSRLIFWRTRHLYFRDQTNEDWWNMLAVIKGQVDSYPDAVPIATRTGKPMVGLGPWNEQLEATSIEPGYSVFQQTGNASPFFVATAAAKVFGGPDSYDTPRPAGPVSPGWPAGKDLWTFGEPASGDTDFWHLSTGGRLRATAGDTDELVCDMRVAISTVTEVAADNYTWAKLRLRVAGGGLDSIELWALGGTFSDTADEFEAPQEPGAEISNVLMIRDGATFIQLADGVREYRFPVANAADWNGRIQFLELRFNPITGQAPLTLELQRFWLE